MTPRLCGNHLLWAVKLSVLAGRSGTLWSRPAHLIGVARQAIRRAAGTRSATEFRVKHRPTNVSRAAAMALLLLAAGSYCPAQSYYSGDLIHAVSLAQYETEAEASRALSGFWGDYPTARVMACGDGNGCHVVIGAFSTHAQAWATGAKLLGRSDVEVVSDVKNGVPLEELELPELPRLFGDSEGLRAAIGELPPVFEDPLGDAKEWEGPPPDSDFVDGFEGAGQPAIDALVRYLGKAPQQHADTAKIMLGRHLLRAKRFQEAETVLSEVASGTTGTKQAEAELALAYVTYFSGDRKKALEEFRAVAADDDAPPQVRLDAMRRAAGIAHLQLDYPNAWLAFSELEAAAPNDAMRAEARLQLAGLALELAGRAKGRYYEVIPLCEAVTSLPEAPRELKATAELIHLESLFFLGEKEYALNEAEAFIREYPDAPRERTSARVWKGVILTQLSRESEAAPVLEALLEEDLTADHKFGGHEPKAMAALWLARIETTRGDREKRDEYLNLIVREYPGTREAREAMQILGIRAVEN
jgi:tetratricopeptide (TPR) repeat protein